MAFRLRDENPVFLDADGNPCAGGSLTFSITGTSTAKNVYAEPALSTNLGNVITLDSAGRPSNAGVPVDVWLDASSTAYRIILKKSDATTVWTRDDVRDLDTAGVTIPDPADAEDGEALVSNGDTLEYRAFLEVPDPTGHANEQLGNDGTAVFWEPKPEATVYDEDNLPGGVEEVTEGSCVIIGHTMIQRGSGTCPTASSAISSTVAITFPTAFGGTPTVVCTPTVGDVTNNSPGDDASITATSPSTTGFTAKAFCGAENNVSTISIDVAVTFGWIAMGPAP